MSVLDIPLGFTYSTRLRSKRGILMYLAYELLPCMLAVYVLGVGAMGAVLCLFIGFAACYECGYLFNDKRVRPDESDGRRLRGSSGPVLLFVGLRVGTVLLMAFLAHVIYPATSIASYVILVSAICALLVMHSTNIVVERGITRVGTFAALAFGKYAVYLIPIVGARNGLWATLSIFTFYGFPRVVIYVIRKYGRESIRDAAAGSQAQLQSFCMLFTGPFVLPLVWSSRTGAESMVSMLWLSYAMVLTCVWTYRYLRLRFSSPLSVNGQLGG